MSSSSWNDAADAAKVLIVLEVPEVRNEIQETCKHTGGKTDQACVWCIFVALALLASAVALAAATHVLMFNHDETYRNVDLLKHQGFQAFTEKEEIMNFDNMGKNKAESRRLNIYENLRWKDRVGDVVIVPFRIVGSFTQAQKELIVKAIDDISTKTGVVKFVPRTTQASFISVRNEPSLGCSSNVGKVGREQYLNLKSPGCVSFGIIQHEFLHALGLTHEQNRPDRDNFVSINWGNIQEEQKRNFVRADGSSLLGSPYEYKSVMHYHAKAFAINQNQPTIFGKQSGSSDMGQRTGFTGYDIKKVKLLYQCKSGPRSWSQYDSAPCTSDCKCQLGDTGCNGNNDACQGNLICSNNQCVAAGGNGGGGGGCTNEPGWVDSDGDGCDFYAKGSNCAAYGDGYHNNGKSANDACCVCGGGSTGSVRFLTFKPAAYLDNCMDLRYASTSNANLIQLYQCNGTPAQKWFRDANHYIRSGINTNKCIVGSGGKTDLGTIIIINDCFANDSRFMWDSYSDDSIRPRNNKLVCLGPTWVNGAWGPLELNDCSTTATKAWKSYYANRRRLSTLSEDPESSLQPEFFQDSQDSQLSLSARKTQAQECEDLPYAWYDALGYNCLWYSEQTDRCTEYGYAALNFGKTAAQACCACGGGSTAVDSIFDSTSVMGDALDNVSGCWDQPGWRDTAGDDCVWYSQGDNCEFYGGGFARDGLVANEACCACGGGFDEEPPADTNLTPGCSNAPNDWVDNEGFGCDYYASMPDACDINGHDVGLNGKTAMQVCCTCGGGFNPGSVQDRGPASPTTSPTTSPAHPPSGTWSTVGPTSAGAYLSFASISTSTFTFVFTISTILAYIFC